VGLGYLNFTVVKYFTATLRSIDVTLYKQDAGHLLCYNVVRTNIVCQSLVGNTPLKIYSGYW